MKSILILSLALVSGAQTLGALPAGGGPSRGDYLNIRLAVIGPGDELYFWWGHLGLIIEDRISGTSRFYDYGVFTFNSDNFISNFALGRLWYTTASGNTDAVLNHYVAANRAITLYTLNLSAEEKLELQRRTEHDIAPENRNYLYNHFKDNCVTRIINNLDAVLNGAFYAKADATPGRLTLRGHVRRHTAEHPVWDWLLNFWMGQVIDTPVTARQEMFLPSETGAFIENYMIRDSEGTRALVSGIDPYYVPKGRPPALDLPWNNMPFAFAVGILLALFFASTLLVSKKNPILGRGLFGAGNALLGIIFGISGSLLFFLEFFTDHDYTYQNSNVIFANPLLLAAVPFGIMLCVCSSEKKRFIAATGLRILWAEVFLASLIALLIKFSPSYYQENNFVLAVFMPVSFVIALIGIYNSRLPCKR